VRVGKLPSRPLLPDPRVRDPLAPLRERLTDLPCSSSSSSADYSSARPSHPGLTPRAWGALSHYSFPGNIRELKHSIQHATILARGGEIDLPHLPPELSGIGATRSSRSAPASRRRCRAHEREYLVRALEVANGERQVAARILGISRKTLWKKLKAFGISHVESPSDLS
jgi:DNA-binding NtrC family response regulator